MTENSGIFRVPKGTPGAGHLELDLTEVRQLEARKDEVGSVNKAKAQELLRAMEKGYSAIANMLPMVSLELNRAEQAADERKAVVMLDEAPRILAEKGLIRPSNPSGSADQRENILALDSEHKKLRENVDLLKATQELLKGKMRGFEMSFQSVKKVFDTPDAYVAGGHIINIPSRAEAGDELDSQGSLKVGIPRY